MSVTVKVISVNGYNDWNVQSVETVQMDEFTIGNCILHNLGEEADEYGPTDLEEMEEDGFEIDGVITLNGEENGHTFVLMS
jgi:hypothetical protein